MKLSIIIPAFNEEKTIKELIQKVKNSKLGNIEKEIIVIDDSSTDSTRDILSSIKDIKVIFQDKNSGKGAAIKKGIKSSTGDIILIQDADLEYNPNEYFSLIEPIITKKTRVVYGSRILRKENKKGKTQFYLGGRVVTFFTNLIYNARLTDEPTCYKVFSKELKPILTNAIGNRFEWEPEVTAKILRKGYLIYEVPISYNPRDKNHGKKINALDGIIAIWTLLYWRFKRIN